MRGFFVFKRPLIITTAIAGHLLPPACTRYPGVHTHPADRGAGHPDIQAPEDQHGCIGWFADRASHPLSKRGRFP